MLAAGLSAFSLPVMAVVAAGITVVAPFGLGLQGRTSPLAWTRRLQDDGRRRSACSTPCCSRLAGAHPHRRAARRAAVLPPAGDPRPGAPGHRPVRAAGRPGATCARAEAKLRSVHPTTVAITGLVRQDDDEGVRAPPRVRRERSVLASPASFNNTGGLSRTLNEHLTPGTEVFVAEMGTYGPGEIRSMCAWVQPDIAVIVNIGPVHLERMKTLDGIVAAKAEIFEQTVTQTAVLNVDAHGLAALADRLAAEGKRVVRVSDRRAPRCRRRACARTTASAESLEVYVGGELRHRIADTAAQPANVAAALGARARPRPADGRRAPPARLLAREPSTASRSRAAPRA